MITLTQVIQLTYAALCASLTMHYLSLTSFSEKIGSGETNECNDGAPLFRLMDCSRGAVFRGFWVRKVATSHQTAGIQSPFYIVWDNNRICVFSAESTDQGIAWVQSKITLLTFTTPGQISFPVINCLSYCLTFPLLAASCRVCGWLSLSRPGSRMPHNCNHFIPHLL